MNRNLEERKIRQWFRDARHADEAAAPSLVALLAAAPSNHRRARRRSNAWRTAFAAIALIVIAVATFVFFKRSAAPLDQKVVLNAKTPERPPAIGEPGLTAPAPPDGIAPSRVPKTRPRRSSLARRRLDAVRPQADIAPSALLSFEWQSPTDFLLRTPGADLLKTVPRVGDSFIQLDLIHPDQEN